MRLPSAPALLAIAVVACATREAPPPPPPPPAPADPEPIRVAPTVRDLTNDLEALRGEGGLPAVAGAAWQGGALIARGVVGVRKLGDPARATFDDRWHLGSDTKAMTATLVGLLVDRGRLRFEATLGELLAGVRIDPGYRAVTVEQLLQHRGGFPGDMPPAIWRRMWDDGAAPTARARAVKGLLARAPAQPPGTFAYSNAGYMVVGAILERVAGQPWERLMERELFGPLGMASCGFGPPGSATVVDQPWGHEIVGTAPVAVAPGPKADNPPSLGPAGTVHCSLTDWHRFLAEHLTDGAGLLTPATRARLHAAPPGGDYAAGWSVMTREWAGGQVLTHTGSNTMWTATAVLAPARGLAFVAVSNRGDVRAIATVERAIVPMIERARE